MSDQLDHLCINTVQQANSGHPGAAPERLREYGFSVEHVSQRALALIEKTKENS